MVKKLFLLFVIVMTIFWAKSQTKDDLLKGNVNVPSYTEGKPSEMLGMFGYWYYKIFIDFEDGSKADGYLYRDRDRVAYYILDGVYYKTKEDAIRALYIYNKYGVITNAGKK